MKTREEIALAVLPAVYVESLNHEMDLYAIASDAFGIADAFIRVRDGETKKVTHYVAHECGDEQDITCVNIGGEHLEAWPKTGSATTATEADWSEFVRAVAHYDAGEGDGYFEECQFDFFAPCGELVATYIVRCDDDMSVTIERRT